MKKVVDISGIGFIMFVQSVLIRTKYCLISKSNKRVYLPGLASGFPGFTRVRSFHFGITQSVTRRNVSFV